MVQADLSEGTVLVNQATVTADTADPNPANNQAIAQTRVTHEG